jgi:hypothetical protein
MTVKQTGSAKDLDNVDLAHARYTRLVNYALAEPPRTEEEMLMLDYFVNDVRLRHVQGATGCYLTANFAEWICLGSEAMLKHYRAHENEKEACEFGNNTNNWRPPKKKSLDYRRPLFKLFQEQVPVEFWELREIRLKSFARIMMPKLRLEGRF